MKIQHILKNTYLIDTGMSNIPFYKIDSQHIILLDTGWAKERERLLKLLKSNALQVAGIINSHAHIDHVGNNSALQQEYNCFVAMPAFGAMLCQKPIYLKSNYYNQTLSTVNEHYESMITKADYLIREEATIDVAGVTFAILPTPGHSPDHICITTPDNVCYVGDALISDEIMRGAKMPYAFVLKEDLKSKEMLHSLDCEAYLLAHRGVFNEIHELIQKNITFYQQRAGKILEVVHDEMTMEEILRAVVSKFQLYAQTPYRYRVIERMLQSYVEYLEETGFLNIVIRDGFIKYFRGDEKMRLPLV